MIGYVPTRYRANQTSREAYLEISTNRRNQRYFGTIAAKIKEWLKEGTVVHYGNRDRVGVKKLARDVRCILPLVVEEVKPRLCIDGIY